MSERGGILHRLYNGETNGQFVARWKLWFALSGLVIVAGLASLGTRGLNLGIDFEGGVVWEVPAGDASVTGVREAVEAAGVTAPNVQTLGSGNDEIIRVQAEIDDEFDRGQVTDALVEETGSDAQDVSFNEVGPSWGDEISEKALRALVIFLVLVSIYIAFRFEWKMALATLTALLHDILVTVGVYSLTGFEVTPATVIAILTILGYSIYDGIVVFDKVDENARVLTSSGNLTYSGMVNRSLNQVLMRTLNTSITALIPIVTLLVVGSFLLGATTLREFALALLVGLASGAYSSIFIASPVLALLKEREERWRNLRDRLAVRRPEADLPALAPIGPVDSSVEAGPSSAMPTRTAPRPPAGTGAITPRGRKQGRRR